MNKIGAPFERTKFISSQKLATICGYYRVLYRAGCIYLSIYVKGLNNELTYVYVFTCELISW